jgi:hypothetical protein
MLTRIRSRLTYANVTATIALFLALGGGAYATTQINGTLIKKNSVPGNRINKKTFVAKATFATNASHAARADNATNASHTASADNAGHAASADSAGHAASADSAGHATSADSAGHADTAGGAPPTGAAGGALAGNYPNPSLTAPEAIHLVGAPGEPPFAAGASNSSGTAHVGFYKDGFGLVHLEGSADAGTPTAEIFTLPAGYRPGGQLDYPAPAFNGSTFTSNRVVVTASGIVYNDRGVGTTYVGLNDVIFRPTQ